MRKLIVAIFIAALAAPATVQAKSVPNPIREYGKLAPMPGPTAYGGGWGAHRPQ